MTGRQVRHIAIVLSGFTTLGVPGYAQVLARDVGVAEPKVVPHSVRSVVELTLRGRNATGQPWLVHQARRRTDPSGRGLCSVCGVLVGAGLGFAVHESGHLIANWGLGTDVYAKKVEAVGIPFFAIAHRDKLPRRREFIVSSAGLWAQAGTAEWLLTSNPRLRSQRAALRKGLLAFHVATSVLYGVAGLAGVGPPERDTLGMAVAIGGRERWAGVIALTPGILDAYRYVYPSATWARWASRLSKVALLIPLLR